MITVTRLNNTELLINAEKIQSVKSTPDTVITFTNKDTIIVREPLEELSRKIIEYQRSIHLGSMIEPGIIQDISNNLIN